MKTLLFLTLLFTAIFLDFIPTQANATVETSTVISTSFDAESEQYVVVYTMNGDTFAIILNHPINCATLKYWTESLTDIEIVDCGSVDNPPYAMPAGTTIVTEQQALEDLQLEEWPE